MLPAIVGLLVALAVFLVLPVALRSSKGRKLLSKLRERAKKQRDDGPMTKGAEVRQNDAQPGMSTLCSQMATKLNNLLTYVSKHV